MLQGAVAVPSTAASVRRLESLATGWVELRFPIHSSSAVAVLATHTVDLHSHVVMGEISDRTHWLARPTEAEYRRNSWLKERADPLRPCVFVRDFDVRASTEDATLLGGCHNQSVPLRFIEVNIKADGMPRRGRLRPCRAHGAAGNRRSDSARASSVNAFWLGRITTGVLSRVADVATN